MLGDTHVRGGKQAVNLQRAITQHMPSVQTKVVDPISNRLGGMVIMCPSPSSSGNENMGVYTRRRDLEQGRNAV